VAQQPENQNTETKPEVLDTATLFKHTNEVWIMHRGVCYRLRITSNDRLILTK